MPRVTAARDDRALPVDTGAALHRLHGRVDAVEQGLSGLLAAQCRADANVERLAADVTELRHSAARVADLLESHQRLLGAIGGQLAAVSQTNQSVASAVNRLSDQLETTRADHRDDVTELRQALERNARARAAADTRHAREIAAIRRGFPQLVAGALFALAAAAVSAAAAVAAYLFPSLLEAVRRVLHTLLEV